MFDTPAYPKELRKQMLELAGIVHEEILRRALIELDRSFEQWRRNEIDSFELEARIHEFHQGSSRRIFDQFGRDRVAERPWKIAVGVAEGIIDISAVPPEIRAEVQRLVNSYKAI